MRFLGRPLRGRAVRIDEAVCLEQRHLRGGPGGRDVAPGTAREPESTCR